MFRLTRKEVLLFIIATTILVLVILSHPLYLATYNTIGEEGYFQLEEGTHIVYLFWVVSPNFTFFISTRPDGWLPLPRVSLGDPFLAEIWGNFYWWKKDGCVYIHIQKRAHS